MLQRILTDGFVSIRPFRGDDADAIALGQDRESIRFLGTQQPDPVACVEVSGVVVGWVDYDHRREWLAEDEVNLGYNVFPAHRGNGYATRAVRLLLSHLATDTTWRVATLLMSADNARSLALARRAGFERLPDFDGYPYWKFELPSLTEGSPTDDSSE